MRAVDLPVERRDALDDEAHRDRRLVRRIRDLRPDEIGGLVRGWEITDARRVGKVDFRERLDKRELIGGRLPIILEKSLEAFSRPYAGCIAHEDQCRGDQASRVPGRFPFGKRKAEALEKRDDELRRKRMSR